MGFVKVVKNRAYFKRFQVKFRRRRECKTDYYARKRLIIQDKNKYMAPKYRFVVRVTNRDIICQVFAAAIDHDRCIAAAYSHELRRYGVPIGLTNYAACYCTGLLLARRINEKLKIPYEGQKEISGEDYHVEEEEGKQAPFNALFDVGLKRTTTGARIFGALKGACDGGLDIPHNDRRFPGTKKTEGKNWEASAEIHRKYILGGHVAEYMRIKEKDGEEGYAKQFKRFIEAGITADGLEGVYTKAHAAIRKAPLLARSAKEKAYFGDARKAAKDPKHKPTKVRKHRIALSIQQRKDKIRQKVASMKKIAAAGVVPKK